MEYRKPGRTELDISVIGLGTMTWGFQNTQLQGFEQMDYALERGINFFDTAEMALAFVNNQAFVSSTLIGATNMAQLKSNIDSITLRLPSEVYQEIDKIRREFPMLY